MTLFFVGIVEMMIITAWTSFVSRAKTMATGLVTFINVLIWYYVMQVIILDINNWRLALLYATGSACGAMLSTLYFTWRRNNPEAVAKWWQIIKNKLYVRRDI